VKHAVFVFQNQPTVSHESTQRHTLNNATQKLKIWTCGSKWMVKHDMIHNVLLLVITHVGVLKSVNVKLTVSIPINLFRQACLCHNVSWNNTSTKNISFKITSSVPINALKLPTVHVLSFCSLLSAFALLHICSSVCAVQVEAVWGAVTRPRSGETVRVWKHSYKKKVSEHFSAQWQCIVCNIHKSQWS
jgi:hypothetical protein